MFLIQVTFFTVFLAMANAKALVVISDQINICNGKGDGGYFDWSNYEFHPENDTHTFINGNLKFLKPSTSIIGHIYLEKYTRGEWLVQTFDRRYENLCVSFHDPSQPFHAYMDSFPPCPIAAGTEWVFDMVPISVPEPLLKAIPPHYMGKWRSTIILGFILDGVTTNECMRVNFEIYEVSDVPGVV